jgi:hypothetical protein
MVFFYHQLSLDNNLTNINYRYLKIIEKINIIFYSQSAIKGTFLFLDKYR